MKITAFGIAMMTLCVSLALASASEIPLGIFGNANMDDTIDEQDIEYVQGIIDGTNDETEFADANYDGKIDEEDVVQIELIIGEVETELIVIDDSGRIVTINKPILRIATLNYRLPEVLIAIGAKGKIVGVEERFTTRIKDLAEACDMMDVPVVGTSTEPNYERILEAEPDVIITTSGMTDEVGEKLPDIPVIGISSFMSSLDYDQIIYDLKFLGMIVDEKDGAADLIDFMQSYEGIIDERTAELNPDDMPTFYLEGPLDYYVYGPSGSPGKLLAEGCGGINVASDVGSASVEVSPEWVIVKNPDIIIKRADFLGLDANEDDAEQALNEIIGRTCWDEISAVKNDRVYLLEGDLMWTPRYLAGRCYLAKWFQPELFEDLAPEDILREYHETFMGTEYCGIWVYPTSEL